MGSAPCQNICPQNQQQIRNKHIQNDPPNQSEKDHQKTNQISSKRKLQPILFDDPDQQIAKQLKQSAAFNSPKFVIQKQTQIQLPLQTKKKMAEISPIKNLQNHQFVSSNEKLVYVNKFYSQSKNESVIQNQDDYQEIKVPFKVIKLSLSKLMIKNILEWDDKFFFRMENTKSFQENWRLIPQGSYTNILQKKFGVFITQNAFYQGYFKKSKQTNIFQPHGSGIFITQQTIYQGNFQKGLAHGQGKFIQNGITYKGQWKNGQLELGIIQSPEYIYIGNFSNKIPHGNGKLVLKQKMISYQGKFKKGKFHDQKGLYQCKQYIYEGGFKNGMKNGRGTLVQKQVISGKNSLIKDLKKYKPPIKLENKMWIDDQCQDDQQIQRLK